MGPAIIFQNGKKSFVRLCGTMSRWCLGSGIVLGLMLSLGSGSAGAQVSAGLGSISGIVHDAGGSVVPDAQVVVVAVAAGAAAVTRSRGTRKKVSAGRCSAIPLSPAFLRDRWRRASVTTTKAKSSRRQAGSALPEARNP